MNLNQIENLYELSPTQQGILFHSLYTPEADIYVGQFGCVLQGDVYPAQLEQSWQTVIQHHAILRTGFQWEGLEKPLQIVYRQVTLTIEQFDWRSQSPEQQYQQLQRYIQQDRQRGFDLTCPPLMRLSLIRLSDDRCHLLWSKHHLILDGWSTAMVLQQIWTTYAALRQGEALPIINSRPFGDYIAWLQQQDLVAAKTFWQDSLKDIAAPTALAIDRRPGDRHISNSIARQSLHLGSEITHALSQFTRQHQLTPNTLMQGAWALLLSRYSGEAQVVFGSTVSGRPPSLAAAETTVGLLINTLPVCVQVSPQATLLPWLQQLQLQQVEMRQYEYTPLVQIQSWSQIPKGTPLFDSLLVFENYPIDTSLQQATDSVAVQDIWTFEQTNYPLTVVIHPGTSWQIELTYDEQRFEPEAIARLLGHLRTLLEGMITNPNQSLAEIPLVTAAEKHQLLFEWNTRNRNTQSPPSGCVHELFEAQVERTPDAIAVTYENQSLTYRELNQRANQLAHYLRSLGIAPEVLVAIAVERSLDLIVGLLGILKAGGAYVPIDPAYPSDRIALMLEDSQAPVLVTQRSLLETLPQHSAQFVCLDSDWDAIRASSGFANARCNSENPMSQVTGENLAYTIYTSGSTGKPKGVQIPHRALANFLHSMRQEPGLTAEDILLSVTTICFDIAALEIYLSLVTGARVVLASRETAMDAQQLIQLIEQSGATVMQATPATWRLLLAAGWQGNPQLKILCGGEALSRELADQLLVRSQSFWNMYGPTETTIWSMVERVEPGNAPVRLGRAIANTQIYVLNQSLQPVPIGVPGELHIGGAGLARGYLNRPELTQERFIANPFRHMSSLPILGEIEVGGADRLYKTGDLVRYLSDGTLEFLGRIDHQVKLRGFRIELSEIEAVLSQHPDVREQVVILRQDGGGNQQLVAYVVPQADATPDPSQLRDWLKAKLPEYMVPGAFVILQALPLTPNGKIDRKQLPAPDWTELTKTFVAPRADTEAAIAKLWAQVLGVDTIGIHDNFFELGGHSLLATQVMSRIREAFEVELPLRCLFESPTVEALAATISQRTQDSTNTSASLKPVDRDTAPLPLSLSQQRLWFLHQLEPNSSAYHLSAALRFTGNLDVAILEHSLNVILERHEILRTQFQILDGEPVQAIAPTLKINIPLVDWQDLPPSIQATKTAQFIQTEIERVFDLGQAPLFRIKLLRLSPTHHLAVLTMHHIITDGWSMNVFVRELTELYTAFITPPCGDAFSEHSSTLFPLPIQYADFAIWQRQRLQGEFLEQQLAYWKQQLQDAPAQLALPADYLAPGFKGERRSYILPPTLSDAVKGLGHQEGATLFMTLLAAFKLLLHRYTDQSDLCVGSPIAGRTQQETEALIGFFVNTLVLRTDLSGQPSFRELLQRVREVTLDAYAHQDVPFEKLVEVLQPERQLNQTPLFQVFFNLLNYRDSKLKLPGVTVEAIANDHSHSKFDLTFYAWEQEDQIHLEWVYNAQRFCPERIAIMQEQFQELLEQVVAKPEQAITQVSLVTPTTQALLPDLQATLPYEWGGSIQSHFSEQAKRDPHRPAVVDCNQTWSYGELEVWSNQLAHYLRSHGIQSQDVVAIYGDRCAALVLALLGIWKASAAFLVLDPSYPVGALRDRLQIARPQGWIQIGANMPDELQAVVQELSCRCELDLSARSAIEHCLQDYSSGNPGIEVKAHDLAYVTFTSGTTGEPKAVLGEHAPLSHFLQWYRKTLQLEPSDRFSLLSGLAHDPLLRDIFAPLGVGATLYIPDAEQIGTPGWLQTWMRQQEITISHLTPAMVQLLLSEGVEDTQPQGIPSLRYVCCGGDILTRSLVERLRAIAPAVTCINVYGTTETPQIMGHYVIPPTVPIEELRDRLPIGKGIADVQLLILNESQQLTGIGEVGEVYVRSPYLARGYLNDEALTQAWFISRTNALGDRLYKTGDFGRYLLDGSIEYLGRRDQQVKIRGFRVELGAIASILTQHPEVQDAVVILHEEASQPQRLIAYVVSPSQAVNLVDSPRTTLKAQLPSYMVPSEIVVLEALPLTPNGKVDRKALPIPERQEVAISNHARSPVEEVLTRIWAQILGLDSVGIHDNFFDLGGHSLLATQVISRLNRAFQIELPLRDLFEAPTVAGLAGRIETALWSVSGEPIPAIQPLSREQTIFPLSFAQRRLWVLDQLEPGNPFYNIPIAVKLSGALEIAALEQSCQEIIQRHANLRTTFTTVEGEPVQAIAPHLPFELPIINLQALPAAEQTVEVQRLITVETQHAFDLFQGPLLRATLLKLSNAEHILLLNLHHIVSDAWSMGVLVRELADLYTAFVSQRPSPLAPLPVQYPDFAVWQQQWLQGDRYQAQLDYWKQQLGGLPVLALPTDHPRPAVQSFRGVSHTIQLSKDLSQQLRSLSQQSGATLFMTLLTAFEALLHWYTGQEDLVVGTDIANRHPVETEGLIGFFVNQLVLRTDASGNPTLTDLLHRVRQVTLDAYTHQDLPFDHLVEALNPPRDLSRTPLFQVKFVLQNAPMPSLSLADLNLEVLEVDRGTTKFDLLINLADTPEGIQGSLYYSTDLFEAASMTRLWERFEFALQYLVAQPESHLSDLVIALTEIDRAQHRRSQQQKLRQMRRKVTPIS
ncbi:amino acid adenylation domain-containing protein [Trichocoleus sp. FACHB-591]|uniref:amino acid adenylation domain-containing protein n=1 Tax=Trichocoleus sp. FACHB-591 TaxID=2692872 RepID=UPI001682C14C|nr:non-ribosomal peptide synthetase [Trichocoleus sp. FACHB-591]MBD2095649.1 amino acid adenylation domain-containing protein [Trichocoleus sp. FACHB-591]